jgi:hypothetical protein
MIEVRRNENGRPIKIQIIRLSGVIGGGGGFGGELSVGQKEPPPDATSEADHSDEDP